MQQQRHVELLNQPKLRFKNSKTNLASVFLSKTLLDFYFIYRNT